MKYTDFLDEVIKSGITGAQHDYRHDPLKLEGAIAGFEACRNKSPDQLAALLEDAGKNVARAYMEGLGNYWKHRCFHAEIEWVCNVISSMLMNEGHPVIITPTARGTKQAATILKGTPR